MFKRRFCSGICYFSVFLLPILLRLLGSNMLQRGNYAREICYFVVVHASPSPLKHKCIMVPCIIYFSLLGQYPFCFFFGVAQAFKRRFCSGICYFLAFLLPVMLRFWGSNMLQRGYYAREIFYFVVVRASPFPLQPVLGCGSFVRGRERKKGDSIPFILSRRDYM